MTRNRTAEGGWLIDRASTGSFTFDGRRVPFLAGDTVASALLAAGDPLVGRSFKLHRPRGLFAPGAQEPNALVVLNDGGRLTPNARATTIPATPGLQVRSQNRWPSLRHDAFGLLDLARAVLPAGFYYKTFMWPASQWLRYERLIRKLAGLGPPPRMADPDIYARRHGHTDVLVAGGGPAGLAAALAAGRAGMDVVLAHSGPAFGGGLHDRGDGPHRAWLAETLQALAALPNVRLLANTTVAGYYDNQTLTLAERPCDAAPVGDGKPVERFWQIHAERVVIATGAHERPLLFADNDRPGVMLASAARRYLWRYGVLAGRTPVIFGSDDTIYELAADLTAAGATVRAIVDLRPDPGAAARRAEAAGLPTFAGAMVARAHGKRRVTAAEIWRLGPRPHLVETMQADAILTAGGFGPTLQLHAQARGALLWDPDFRAFLPGPPVADNRSAGGARGVFDLQAAIRDGDEAGANAPLPLRPPPPRGRRPGALGLAEPDRRAALRRSPERRRGQGHRARRPRRLPLHRTCEALHDPWHGHGSGQACRADRLGAAGGGDRKGHRGDRRHHLPPARDACDLRRGRRRRFRRGRPRHTPHRRRRLA